jgi:hypothetical protein
MRAATSWMGSAGWLCCANGRALASVCASQDTCMDAFASGELTENESVTWLVVMAEVRMTCQRPGSFSKDWFDRKGLVVAWADKHVMKVGNATWAREGMTIELPDGTMEEGALRMQQKIERIKFNMLEGGYEYDMSGTPGTCARSNTQ